MNTEMFWTQIGAYHQATFPIPIILTLAAMILTYLVFTKPGPRTDAWMKAFLALAFGWNGVVYFLIFAKNPISLFIGAPLFILVSIFFVVDIFTKVTTFKLPDTKGKKLATGLWILLVFFYPLFSLIFGHAYPQTITPMMPCPLTTFALAMVVAAAPEVDRKIYILLLPWALLGLPKCLGALDCYEDCILFAAGVYGLVWLIRDWKLLKLRHQTAS
jgi:hypothetical protein